MGPWSNILSLLSLTSCFNPFQVSAFIRHKLPAAVSADQVIAQYVFTGKVRLSGHVTASRNITVWPMYNR